MSTVIEVEIDVPGRPITFAIDVPVVELIP